MASPLIEELRSLLATAFASGVSSAAGEIDQNLQRSSAGEGDANRKRDYLAARNFFASHLTAFERALDSEFRKRFTEKLAGETDPFSRTQTFSLDSLSLVEDTDVDENILIANTGRRLRDDCEYELFAISRRLEILMEVEHLDDGHNPASPRTFCRAFLVALATIDASPAVRTHIFNAAKSALTRILQNTYRNANEFLMNQGVLIEIQQRYGKPILQAEARTVAPAATPPANEAQAVMSVAPPPAAPARAIPAPPRSREPPAGDLNVTALFAQLLAQYGVNATSAMSASKPESRLTASLGGAGNAPAADADAPGPPAGSLHAVLDSLAANMPPAEKVITDLVVRTFDGIFAAPELSDAIKAQVARLQFPVLKAALRDSSLLTDDSHPLRILIDQLADLSRRRSASLQPGDATFERVRTLLQYLLAIIESDPLGMPDVNEQLQDLIEADDDGVLHAIEDAVVQQLEGERKKRAFDIASYEIERRIAGTATPEVVKLFATKAWRWLLMIDYLAEGEDSEDWRKDIATFDDLLWSVDPASASDPRLPVLILQLVARLNEALNRAGVARTERVAFYDRLAEIHHGVLDPVTSSNSRRAAAALAAASPSLAPPADPRTASPQRSLRLARGAWVRTRVNGVGAQLCRLLWLSPLQESCIFRNYSAVDPQDSTVIMSAEELDEAFKRGTLTVLGNASLTQRCIENALREMLQSEAAD
ncbi:MAG TPA: DUF1631 family protein [Usitatibacteraceae bacterium]